MKHYPYLEVMQSTILIIFILAFSVWFFLGTNESRVCPFGLFEFFIGILLLGLKMFSLVTILSGVALFLCLFFLLQ